MTTPDAAVILLDSEDVLAAAVRELANRDPVLADLLRFGIVPPLRRRAPGLAGLLSIVVSQQVSTASAAAIWARVEDRLGAITADAVLAATAETLRASGLSGAKARTFRAVAAAVATGALPLDRLHALSAETAHASLTAVAGIGPWTADVYLMFCLGHPDAFAAGDLALQEAARVAYGLPARPDARALTALAERWRPHRAVAARILWAFYRVRTSREGAPP